MIKNVKSKVLIYLLLLGVFSSSYGQEKVFENISKAYLRNMGEITEENEVTGYYMFYQSEKLSRKEFSYELEILDQNLNPIASKNIIGSKYLFLLEGAYNGDALMMKFYDAKEKMIINRAYGKKAEELKVEKREISKKEQNMLAMSSFAETFDMFPVNNLGFVDYRVKKIGSKYGYEMYFFPTKAGMKPWTITSKEGLKLHETATFLYGDEKVILSSVMTKKSLMSKSVEMELLATDAKTGKTLFRKKVEDPSYELMVLNGYESNEPGYIHLFGNYFPKGVKELSNSNLGLFSLKVDLTGKIVEKKFVSWAKDVSAFLPVNERGKMEKVGYTYFHKIVRNADGNVYAIGEQYRKQVSALGVASLVLNGSNSNTSTAEMVVEDLMIFEFNSDFALKNVNIVDKTKTRVYLPQGAEWNGPQILAYYIKSYGGFDYEFLQFNKDKSVLTIGYLDYEKLKGEKSKNILGTVSYLEDKSTTDKIELSKVRSSDRVRILPGKEGNVLIAEYLSKEKKLDLHLEKINY